MARKDIYATDYSSIGTLSETESQILSQYQLLAIQLNTLNNEIKQLNSGEIVVAENASSEQEEVVDKHNSADHLLDSLRNLEMKIGLVYTLFKGAVYSLFLQYEEDQNLKNDEEQRKTYDNENSESEEAEEGEEGEDNFEEKDEEE